MHCRKTLKNYSFRSLLKYLLKSIFYVLNILLGIYWHSLIEIRENMVYISSNVKITFSLWACKNQQFFEAKFNWIDPTLHFFYYAFASWSKRAKESGLLLYRPFYISCSNLKKVFQPKQFFMEGDKSFGGFRGWGGGKDPLKCSKKPLRPTEPLRTPKNTFLKHRE